MTARLFLLLLVICICTLVGGCRQKSTETLSRVTGLPADSSHFTPIQARAVAVAKAEYEKHQGKEARYQFTSTPEGYRIFIEPVVSYDHGQPFTDPNARCSILVSTQFTVLKFYGGV